MAVAGFGMLMLNFAFLAYYFFHQAVLAAVGIFGPPSALERNRWFPPLVYFAYLAIIGAVSWLIFKSKSRTLYKAICLPVPAAAVSATIGMFFYARPVAVYALNAFFYAGILHYFSRAKKPWIYYYAVILVGLVLMFLLLTGGDI